METINKPREPEEFWLNHIAAYHESRQSKASYVRSQGLRYMQFLYWFDKLTKDDDRGNPLKWMPVKIKSFSNAPVLASVKIERGYCVEIHDVNALAYLLRKK